MSYTIAEDFVLPSGGKIYPVNVDPHIKLRSMTVEDEMKRLSHSDRPYKLLCDIIDDCMVEKCAISSYDMCLGDYQYLLYKLRTVTYGSDYKLTSTCPYCGTQNEAVVDMDKFLVDEYDESIEKLFEIELPVSKKRVGLAYQTPRMLDDINLRKKEILKKSTNKNENQDFLLTLMYLVKSVDGAKQNPVTVEQFIRKLSARDANKIIKTADKINRSIGVNTDLHFDECSLCSLKYDYPFRFTPEFFGPAED